MDTPARSPASGIGRDVLALGAVDIAILAVIIVVGQLSHGVEPLAEPLVALETVVPFAVGWLVMAPLAGLYAPGVATSLTRTVRVTTVAWVAAANVGMILRASALFDGGAAWPFPLVMTGFGLLVLVGWRGAYAAYADTRR
ncbi:DUF3054 domain-containing protein [Natronococcus occultus]|uniref:DUF3054 domain-containing protein n=1 Tax=Natronococcus occultus SP4 TaxID=694430 RepID=L0K217_9EURY|nr:DUF3054 domain-containing protein [Natronococcus occultus]AGB39327.1 Protein of unknown function (DUF3054) [Natronococcus occultus SP4]